MPKKITHEFTAMGSPCKFVFYTETHFSCRVIIEQICAEVNRLESKYSRFKSDSVTSEINDIANESSPEKRRIIVDNETAKLLNFAHVAYTQSDGLFDISSGRFRQIWNFNSTDVPNDSQINEIIHQVGWHKLIWHAPELYFPQPNMELDFGGLVKEYAVDKVCAILKKNQVNHAYIDLGGDIGIVGPRIDGLAWNIGIRDPKNPNLPIATIELKIGAIASSGNYERYMESKGQRYTHIINPKTGRPVTYWAGVSVVASQCIIAGTAATTTMLMEQKGEQWLSDLGLRAIAKTNSDKVLRYFSEQSLEAV